MLQTYRQDCDVYQTQGIHAHEHYLYNHPSVHVSCTVVSPCADEGLVVVMAPAGGAELLISVTVPNY